jgi:hypothetical protein
LDHVSDRQPDASPDGSESTDPQHADELFRQMEMTHDDAVFGSLADPALSNAFDPLLWPLDDPATRMTVDRLLIPGAEQGDPAPYTATDQPTGNVDSGAAVAHLPTVAESAETNADRRASGTAPDREGGLVELLAREAASNSVPSLIASQPPAVPGWVERPISVDGQVGVLRRLDLAAAEHVSLEAVDAARVPLRQGDLSALLWADARHQAGIDPAIPGAARAESGGQAAARFTRYWPILLPAVVVAGRIWQRRRNRAANTPIPTAESKPIRV